MFFFEGKHELYYIFCLTVVPFLSILPFLFGKPPKIWFALILDPFLFIAVTAIFFPFYLTDIICGNLDSTTAYWLFLFVPIQLSATVTLTATIFAIKSRRR